MMVSMESDARNNYPDNHRIYCFSIPITWCRGSAGSLERAEERIFLRRVEVVAVPPAAAQRLEQRHGVGEAIGLRLDARDPRLQVGLLCIENQEVVDLAELQAPAC